MANWNTAYNWMMDNEDPRRQCAQLQDACPGGVAGPCYSISGINSGMWPEEYAAIAALPQAEREPLVRQFYENHFWNTWYAQLVSDDLAKRVFDFTVNGGSGTSVVCLQQALNVLTGPDGAQLVDDGDWCAMTVDAVNSADPKALVAAFQEQRIRYYRAIAASSPSLAIYLPAWTARAEK
jgi:lysozyme family protein